MAHVTANVSINLGNGHAEVELAKHYDLSGESTLFIITLHHDEKECSISRIDVSEMKSLIKQMQMLVDIDEME